MNERTPTPKNTPNVRTTRRPDDDGIHLVENGRPGAPVLLLLGNAAVPLSLWDPVIPALAGTFRVLRCDLSGGGRSPRRDDVPSQARRVSAALDKLGVTRLIAVGHSSGCTVATSLAEQRPDAVTSLVVISLGSTVDAKIPEKRVVRLMFTPVIGPLLWRLKSAATVRKGARTAFARPVDLPDEFVEHVLAMPHRSFVAAMRPPLTYLSQRNLPDRLTGLGVPVLVIFGTDDQRWRSSSAGEYRRVPGARVELLPGVGHTPMMEAPQATGTMLLEFASNIAKISYPSA